jgi:hypothetical protein
MKNKKFKKLFKHNNQILNKINKKISKKSPIWKILIKYNYKNNKK